MFSVFHYIFEFLFFNNFIGIFKKKKDKIICGGIFKKKKDKIICGGIFKNKKSKIIYGGMEIDEDYGQFVDLDETF